MQVRRSKKKSAEALAWDLDDPRGSGLELSFVTYWKAFGRGLPRPVREYRFARPEREWPFDFCWPEHKVAVELQGGSWVRGRHNRGGGMRNDFEKQNTAVLMGYRVLYATTDQLSDDPEGFVNQIEVLLLNLKGVSRAA